MGEKERRKSSGGQMQNRRIAVEIKTIDEKHCSKRCKQFDIVLFDGGAMCNEFGEFLDMKKNRYLRTKQCLKREIK
jgi:hypothetical protein